MWETTGSITLKYIFHMADFQKANVSSDEAKAKQ